MLSTKEISGTNFLDQNGYLILKDVIPDQHIQKTKQKIQELLKTEAPRNGEFGYSQTRENLLKNHKRIALFLFDFLFLFLKKLLRLVCLIFPSVHEFLKLYRTKPFDYEQSGSLKNEIRQMFICIIEQFENPRDQRVCDLVNKGSVFDVFYQHERVLPLVEHVIGDDFKLSSLNHRSPQKNNFQQDLHVDYPWAVSGDTYYACNALFLLDDMDESNGATRVVPGSQKSGMMPYGKMNDQKAKHADELIINAKAGDVIFLNSHVWHGGTINKSGNERAVIQSYFVHRSHPPQQYQRFQIRPETEKRLSKKALDILDIHGVNKAGIKE